MNAGIGGVGVGGEGGGLVSGSGHGNDGMAPSRTDHLQDALAAAEATLDTLAEQTKAAHRAYRAATDRQDAAAGKMARAARQFTEDRRAMAHEGDLADVDLSRVPGDTLYIKVDGHIWEYWAGPCPDGCGKLIAWAPGVIPFNAASVQEVRDVLRHVQAKEAAK